MTDARLAASAAIAEAIADAPVFDTHEHLKPMPEGAFGLAELVAGSYVRLCARRPDGSANSLGDDFEFRLEDGDLDEVGRLLAATRHNGFASALRLGLEAVYGFDGSLDRASLESLDRAVRERYADPGWLGAGLDSANVRAVLWDPFWAPGHHEVIEPRFRPSFRINSAVVAFHPEASDFEGTNLVRDWGARLDLSVDSLADLETLIARVLERNLAAGCVSLKSALAYDRGIGAERVSRADAERVFGLRPEQASPEQRRLFGDYVVRHCLELAREHGLVFQVHTGLARLADSHPLLLEPLLQDFPEVVFDLFHGGYPWVRELGALSFAYPNVRLNLVWLPQISQHAAKEALLEWLQVCPRSGRISWGGDCQRVEEALGALLAAKAAIAEALAELVVVGRSTVPEAVVTAREILLDAPARIYGVDVV